MNYGRGVQAPESTIKRARRLRRRLTPPEVRLWVQLRGKAQDLRFRRQHPIGPFVLDFYCDRLKLAVEVDGEAHWLGSAPLRDIERDEWLALKGVRVLRLPACLVMRDMDTTIRTILAEAEMLGWEPPTNV
jgi:very-short-patch-repair endonuclease